MRNLVWTPLDELRLPYSRISDRLIAMGDSVYFAVVPYCRNFASEVDHLSMLIWAASDEAAICSLANDDRLMPNHNIAPPRWATINDLFRYGDVSALRDCTETAAYSGTSGKFRWKAIAILAQAYLYADEEIDNSQLPSVIHIRNNTS